MRKGKEERRRENLQAHQEGESRGNAQDVGQRMGFLIVYGEPAWDLHAQEKEWRINAILYLYET
ncbi:MAG TPA: hypothetical protein DHV12_10360 [Thermotogae bacterium]|nr:hypothetical protein [Thermotogota bacterium]